MDSSGSTSPAAASERHAGNHCVTCGEVRFRRSRLRREDAWQLARLRWPVRCLRCNKRQYAPLTDALRAMPAKMPHPMAANQNQSWESYTSGEDVDLRANAPD